MEGPALSIYTLAKSCVSQFEQLLTAQDPECFQQLESHLADFNLWADGVGALTNTRASLDSRLRGRAKDLALVNNVLQMLSDSLEYYTDLSSNDQGREVALENIESAIENLALIGVAIRRTGKASRNRRADQTFDPDEHQEFRKHLECIILLRPTKEALFQKTKDGRFVTRLETSKLTVLQNRLIEANLRRRHNFLRAQRHSKAQEGAHMMRMDTPVPLLTGNSTNKENSNVPKSGAGLQAAAPGPITKNRLAAGVTPTLSGISSASTAEGSLSYSPAIHRSKPGIAKTQITMIASDAEFPQAPSQSKQSMYKCPCCCQTLPVSTIQDAKMWKKHIIEDLCPYTCIADNCPTPQNLFCTRIEWENHVKNSHLPKWECSFCEAQSPTMESMGIHLQTEHQDELEDKSLPTLLSWCAVQTMGIKDCPLCPSTAAEDSPELIDHVLQHSYDFALRALPWTQTIADGSNAPPGIFCLPPVPLEAEYLQEWISNAKHESAGEPQLEICSYDQADHSISVSANESVSGEYFDDTHPYFDERSEDGSFQKQDDRDTSLSLSTGPENSDATAYHSIYMGPEKVEDLEAAISRAEEELVETPIDHSDIAGRLKNLVNVYFEQFRHTLENEEDLIFVLQAAAPLRFFLIQSGQQETVTVVENQVTALFVKRNDLHTLSLESPRIFILGILDQLGSGRNKDLNESVILASNNSVSKLNAAEKFPEAYDIANFAFLFASRHNGYNGPRAVGQGFKLASLLVGRDSPKTTDASLRKKILELSNDIVKEIFKICEVREINLAQVQLYELSHLSALLGEQQDYKTLEWLLASLWNTREAQDSWPAEVQLNIGRCLICARYLAGSPITAIRLAEDIVYNLRRACGASALVTIETYDLLAELYTSAGFTMQIKGDKSDLAIAHESFKKAFSVHEVILRRMVHDHEVEEDSHEELDTAAYLLARGPINVEGQSDNNTPSLDPNNIDRPAIALRHFRLLKLAYQRLGCWPKPYEVYEQLNAALFLTFGSEPSWKGVEGTEKWSAKDFGCGKAESLDGSFQGIPSWSFGSNELILGAQGQHQSETYNYEFGVGREEEG